jgi:hypothetical protein
MPLRRIEALSGLAIAAGEADIAATATAAIIAVRDEQHMALPAGVASRLDQAGQRWAAIIGADQWTQHVDALTTRPHDELLDLLVGQRATPPN